MLTRTHFTRLAKWQAEATKRNYTIKEQDLGTRGKVWHAFDRNGFPVGSFDCAVPYGTFHQR